MATVKLNPDTGKVTGTHTDMPLLIIPSVITNLGTLTLAEAQSCRIYSDVGLTTELAREVVSADEIHVKIPSASSSTEIWFDYDGIASDYAVTATYGRNAVWSNYELVHHNVNSTDSAGNHNVTANGGVTLGGVTGQLGVGTDFDGSNDSATHTTTTLGAKNAYSIQFWANPDTVSTRMGMVMNDDGAGFATAAFGVEMRSGGVLHLRHSTSASSGGFSEFISSSNPVVISAWQKITCSRNSNVANFYRNAATMGSTSALNSAATNNIAKFGFGAFGIGAFLYYNGKMDEVRIANFEVSANWETTEYNNQNDNASFWVATPVGGGGGNDQAGYLVWL